MKINSNIAALTAARHMNKTNDKISSSLSKLSSGYKLNSVGDDPSSTAVANKIKAQLNGLKIANKNSLDGVSLVQTAEGAMNEVHEMLKRMRELAVQSANDSNAPDDRLKMQMEIDQLVEAVDQMADVTEFNQMKLLNGSLSNLTTITQDTAGVTAVSYDLSIKYMSPNFPTGEYSLEVDSEFTCASITGTFSLGKGTIKLNNDTIEITADDLAADIMEKLTDLADRYNCKVRFTGGNSFVFASKEAGEQVSLEMSGSNVTVSSPAVQPATGTSSTITLNSGFSAAASYKIEGNRIIITESGGAQIQIDLNSAKDFSDPAVNGTYKIRIEDKGQLKLQTGANEDQRIALMIPGLSSYSLGLRKMAFSDDGTGALTGEDGVNVVNVKNSSDAQRSIDFLDSAVSKVSTMRATLGAYQNRLEHTVRSLEINSTNTEESLSRIQDTDMAIEMSQYTLNNVILQSAIAMLSQANERPQQLLQLLR